MGEAPYGSSRPSPSRRTKLGWRLLGWFLALSLLPLLASNTIGYVRSESITEGLVEHSLESLSLLEVFHVQNRVERHLLFLQAVAAGSPSLAAAAPTGRGATESLEALRTYLRRQLSEGGGAFGGLFLLDAERRLMVETSGPTDGPSADVCAHGVTGIAAISTEVNAPPAVCISEPLSDPDGTPVAWVGGLVRPEDLEGFLRFPPQPETPMRTVILDVANRPLYFSERGETESYSEPFETRLAGPDTRARYVNHLGVDVVGRRTQIPGLPWSQITEVPIDSALNALRSLRRTSGYFAAAFTLLVIAAAWFVSAGIVAPIQRLVVATRRLAGGDLDARVTSHGNDEVGELSRAFNDMAEELAKASARVTELHQRDIERAEHLASVGELASGLAHEIKNPLVGITHGLDLVRRRVGTNPAVEPLLGEVTRELRRIENAIRDLLAFARPASPALVPTDINGVSERAIRLVQPFAERHGVSLVTAFHPGLPEVMADADLLEQAVVNVVLNAIEAAPHGEVQISIDDRGTEVVLSVSDNGTGIPYEGLEHVFKPFFTTRVKGGTGLGLPITRKIVERHGGRVTLESKEGLGTTVEILLPLPERSASRERVPSPSGSS